MKLNTYLYLTFFMFISKGMDAKSIEIGATIPTVQATLDSGNMLDLASSSAEGYTLVYFYPKANTPGCTKQACSLRDAYEVLVEKGVKVYGVSKDSVKSQTSFKEKYSLPFSLVADSKSKVIKAFGVTQKLGFASRQAFLFQDGKLVWRDLAASTSKQAEDVLAFLNSTENKSQ
jgi:peroxiredoxin Q/BCP